MNKSEKISALLDENYSLKKQVKDLLCEVGDIRDLLNDLVVNWENHTPARTMEDMSYIVYAYRQKYPKSE